MIKSVLCLKINRVFIHFQLSSLSVCKYHNLFTHFKFSKCNVSRLVFLLLVPGSPLQSCLPGGYQQAEARGRLVRSSAGLQGGVWLLTHCPTLVTNVSYCQVKRGFRSKQVHCPSSPCCTCPALAEVGPLGRDLSISLSVRDIVEELTIQNRAETLCRTLKSSVLSLRSIS